MESNNSDEQQTRFSDTAPVHSPSPLPSQFNRKIGHYTLVHQLGEGGMGTVYRAEQSTPIERQVAIKIVKREIQSSSLVERFKFERQTLARLNHANISAVLDVGSTMDGLPYFAMELVSGQRISTYCDNHSLSIPERLKLFRQACSAISYAHRKGVLHRDIKPSNILVEGKDNDVQLKVIDFGLAKLIGEEEAKGKKNEVIGTISYMSPEQAKGESSSIDTRSDIYSLGVVLFELVLGELPKQEVVPISQGDEKTVVQQNSLSGSHYSAPSQYLKSGSKKTGDFFNKRKSSKQHLMKILKNDLDWIISKATAEDRDNRCQSCDELISDIDLFLNGSPVAARPNTLAYVASKWITKNKLAFVTSCFLAAMIVGILISGWYLAWWANKQANAQKIAASNATKAKLRAEESEKKTKEAMVELSRLREAAEKAKTQAVVSKGRSEAALSLIVESLTLLDPANTGQDLSAGDALIRAYEKVDKQFKDDPIGKAKILTTLGTSFLGLAKFKAGISSSKKAIEILEKHGKGASEDALNARISLIRMYGIGEENQKHLDMLNESVKICNENQDKSSLAQIRIHMLHAQHLVGNGKTVDKAVKLYEEAIKNLDLYFGPDYYASLIAKSEFAKILLFANKRVRARKQAYESQKNMETAFTPEHPNSLIGKMRVAEIEELLQNFNESEKLYREVYLGLKKTLSISHPDTVNVGLKWTKVLLYLNQAKQAEEVANKLMQISIRLNGKTHRSSIKSMQLLAKAYSRNKKHGKAIRLQLAACRYLKEKEPKGSERILLGNLNLAEIYLDGKHFSQGYKYFEIVHKGMNYNNTSLTFPQRRTLSGLAICGMNLGRFKEAKKAVKQKIEIEKKYLPDTHPEFSRSYHLLGKIQMIDSDWDGAVDSFKRSIRVSNHSFKEGKLSVDIINSILTQELLVQLYKTKRDRQAFLQTQREIVECAYNACNSLDEKGIAEISQRGCQAIFSHSLTRPKNQEEKEQIRSFCNEQFKRLVKLQNEKLGQDHHASLVSKSIYIRFLENSGRFSEALKYALECRTGFESFMKKNPDQNRILLSATYNSQQIVALYHATYDEKTMEIAAKKSLECFERLLKATQDGHISRSQTFHIVLAALEHKGWSESQITRLTEMKEELEAPN